MKILFVSEYIDSVPCGARTNARVHLKSIQSLADGGGVLSLLAKINSEIVPEEGRIYVRCRRNHFDSLRNLMAGNIAGYSSGAENRILAEIRNNSFDLVWFDNKLFGSTVRMIKQEFPALPVYVFYHTVADMNIAQSVKTNLRNNKFKAPFKVWSYINILRQERLSAEYADASILLNERDRAVFMKQYGKDADLLLQTCQEDIARIVQVARTDGEFSLLFVGGGRHMQNVDGIRWFAANVMPYVKEGVVLNIVGLGMEQWRGLPEFRSPRVKIVGGVDSLDDCYNAADAAVMPIFYGPGMITKVTEALMYGKNFLATSHALNGYDGLEDFRCDTAEEYIARINGMAASGVERFNPALRKIYEERYSVEAATRILRGFFVRRKLLHGDDE